MSSRLASILSSINGNSNGNGYSARAIPNSKLHFIGRDSNTLPVLFLGSRDTPTSLALPIKLKGIEVQFATPCRLGLPDGKVIERNLSIVRCVALEAELQNYFLQIVETILNLIGPDPSYTQITGAIRKMIDLFQRLLRPPTRQVQGLYGELLIIAWSSNAHDTLQAWRTESKSRFDFILDNLRMDVKTTSSRVRVHHFSLEQCSQIPGTIGVISSIQIEPGSGATLGDLVTRIEVRVSDDPTLQIKLHEIVADSLGNFIVEGLKTRFDDQGARGSLAFFYVDDIPTPSKLVPPAVSEVRFKTDLSSIQPIDRSVIIAACTSAAKILPTL